jgi:hypothetical protein
VLPAWPRDVLEAVLVSNVLKKKQTLEDLTLTKGSIRMLLLDDTRGGAGAPPGGALGLLARPLNTA